MAFNELLVIIFFCIFAVFTLVRILLSIPVYKLIKEKHPKVYKEYAAKNPPVGKLFLSPQGAKLSWDILFTTNLYLSEELSVKLKTLKLISYFHVLSAILLLIYVISIFL